MNHDNNIELDYNTIKTFGCLCYLHEISRENKFTPRTRRGVFLGYIEGVKGYLIQDMETESFLISRNVVFKENFYPYKIMKESLNNLSKKEKKHF